MNNKEVTYLPIYDRILVKRLEEQEIKSAGGIILSQENKPNIGRGYVLRCGSGKDEKGSNVSADDIVIFNKYAGVDVGNDMLILKEDEILAIEVER